MFVVLVIVVLVACFVCVFLVVGCLWFVDCRSLFVVCCRLYVVYVFFECCPLFVASRVLFLVFMSMYYCLLLLVFVVY